VTILIAKESTMIDISEYGFQFRGYPVTVASEGVMALLRRDGHGVACRLSWILQSATDTAELDEPSGWIFEAQLGTPAKPIPVWIERFGGIRDTDRHEGGQWSVYLSSER
jgi:hypothetical protein